MKAQILHLNYFRKGRATNSSSTHSVIYKNKGDIFNDLNVFEEDYYGRCLNTIAVTKKAKIKYVFTCIYEWDVMAEALSKRYPQMTKYFELVKTFKTLSNTKFSKVSFLTLDFVQPLFLFLPKHL